MCSLLKRKLWALLDLRVRVVETIPGVSIMSSKAGVFSKRETVLLYYYCDMLGGVIMVLSCRSILSYFCTAIRHVTLLAITGAILAVLNIPSQIATTHLNIWRNTVYAMYYRYTCKRVISRGCMVNTNVGP